MISLGWYSIAHMRLSVDVEETSIRRLQTVIEFDRAHREQNRHLVKRWFDESKLCEERHRNLMADMSASLANPQTDHANRRRELDETAQRCPGFVAQKHQLEYDLLCLQQRYEQHQRAVGSTDDLQISQAYEQFEAQRQHVERSMADFRRQLDCV
jgi:hypothetical protein